VIWSSQSRSTIIDIQELYIPGPFKGIFRNESKSLAGEKKDSFLKEKNYWRAVSLLPILVPLTALLWSSIRTVFTSSPNPPASIGQVFLLGSLYIGGVFYLLFLAITQFVIWKKPVQWDRRTSLIAPPVFLILFILGFQVYWIITASGSWLDSPRALMIYSVLVIIFGYLYVGLAWGLRGIVRGLGMIIGKKQQP
jgi:hypothetical protein